MARGLFAHFVIIFAVCLLVTRGCGAEEAGGKHFLWRVTNVDHPFYLLGSYHALHGGDYPLGREIDQALDQSKRLVFEYDMVHLDQAAFSRKLDQASRYPAGVTLKQKVRPETYAYAQKIAHTRASAYNDRKPWAIAFFMMSHHHYYNFYQYFGVENYARRRSPMAEVGGLETPEEHLRVLSDMSDIESEVFLLQTFVHIDQNTRSLPKEIAAYKRGDTAGLVALEAAKDREAPYITWRLIDRRNAQWIPRIEQEIKTGKPTTIIVGARHLCGPHNVIDSLRARGYQLEQL